MSTVTQAALLRLVHQIIEHNPALARQLCQRGLESIDSSTERQQWLEKLQPFLEDKDVSDESSDWLLSA